MYFFFGAVLEEDPAIAIRDPVNGIWVSKQVGGQWQEPTLVWLQGYDELALEFYENGSLLRSYRVSDLVAAPQELPRTVSHLAWRAESEFDADKGELYLRTENDEEHLFDVTTGELIEKRRPITVPPCLLVGGIVFLGPVGATLIGKRSKSS